MTEIGDRDHSYCGTSVAVLGASGFIGRWVARALCSRGANLHLLVRSGAVAEKIFSRYGIRGSLVEVDFRELERAGELLQKIRPSTVFNLVGYGIDPSEQDHMTAYQINASLVKVIGEAIATARDPGWLGQDVVHVGSAFEYGAIDDDLSEDSLANPTTLYGQSKLAGTYLFAQCCVTHRLKGVTARLFTVYGPGEHRGRLLPSLLESARMGKPLTLTAGDQKRDFTYVEDVAEGLLRLGVTPAMPGEIVNLATGHLVSVRAFAETAARILGIPSDGLQFGSVPTRREEMKHAVVTLERLRRLIGWVPPTGIEVGICKTRDFARVYGDGED